MQFQTIFFVGFFMAVPAACLVWAWQRRKQDGSDLVAKGWRDRLPNAGLVFATFCMVLISGFLFQGHNPDGQSFASPAPHIWLVLNWVSMLAWAVACFATAIGKGKIRIPLLLWCLSMPAFSFAAAMSGYLY